MRGSRPWRYLLLLASLWLGGCESLSYYAQSANGQLQLLNSARDIRELLADPEVADELKERLRRVQQIRQFAVEQLALPDNDSYQRYADVGREALVWSVIAAPRLQLQAHQWCYPVIGCASYRGYFDPHTAHAFAEGLDTEGWDAAVERVPAYSTLGWFDDPLPSTVIDWPEADLAGLVFHELAHQRLYARDDSAFNESYATVVEKEGVRRWLRWRQAQQPGAGGVLERWRLAEQRAEQFRALIGETRARLATLYAGEGPEQFKLGRKAQLFAQLQSDYSLLKQSWDGYSGYDRWMQRDLNNAHLMGLQTYTRWLPALRHLLHGLHGDMQAFHRECEALAEAPFDERQARLRQLQAAAAALPAD